jgi:hypothetical protein
MLMSFIFSRVAGLCSSILELPRLISSSNLIITLRDAFHVNEPDSEWWLRWLERAWPASRINMPDSNQNGDGSGVAFNRGY